ncbi:hypothetical protein [Tissierella sp.]|uniref:hypothetical protein n=1 Tax=Tissierella sp. TaxID=41274 RepID=UPI0030569464
MFIKGLIHRVDIYPMKRNTSNRTSKAQVQTEERTMENVKCRIIKDEKIMFESSMVLEKGDLIKDINSNDEYMIEDDGYKAIGFDVHHRTYKIKKKVI